MNVLNWRSIVHPKLPFRLLLLCVFLLLNGLGYIFSAIDSLNQNNFSEALFAALAVCILAAPALGLLKLKAWAWKTEIVFLGLGLVLQISLLLYNLISTTHSAIGLVLAAGPFIVLNIILLAYLLGAECRSLFQQ